ncbi:MAG: OmpA family protein, partial [Gammaproteobacteria bacterium]
AFADPDPHPGYWSSSSGQVVKSGFGLCWRSGDWVPANATEECDAHLMEQAEAPAPAPAPPAYEAPEVSHERPAAGTVIFTIEDVNFAFDKSELRPQATDTLQRAVRKLEEGSDLNVALEGHTDSVGSDAYNQKLSERRARAVYDYLVANGIAMSRLQTVGRGEDQPIATNATPEGRARNRRVELVVTD